MSLQSLPNEVMTQCTSYLSYDDQRKTRLVSRTFEIIFRENMFINSIDLSLHPNSLESKIITYGHLKAIRRKSILHQTLSGNDSNHALIHIAFSPDGKSIATATEVVGENSIWDTRTGKSLHSLSGHTGGVNLIVYSPDGKRIVTASLDKTCRIWNSETGDCMNTLSGHTDMILSVAFSLDGKSIATASSSDTYRIWDIQTGKCLETFAISCPEFGSNVIRPDEKSIIAAYLHKTCSILETKTGDFFCDLNGHVFEIHRVSLSSDGKRIAIAYRDRASRIWDIQTGKCLYYFAAECPSDARSAVYSPDGQFYAKSEWWCFKCEIYNRNPTPEEKLIAAISESDSEILPKNLQDIPQSELIEYSIRFIAESNFQSIKMLHINNRIDFCLENFWIDDCVYKMKAMPAEISSKILLSFLDKTIPYLEEVNTEHSYAGLIGTIQRLKDYKQKKLIAKVVQDEKNETIVTGIFALNMLFNKRK